MEVGDFVRQERKRQQLTQKQLADLAGVGLNFVYQLEKNKKTVQLDTTNLVLTALGYKISVQRDFNPWKRQGASAKDSRPGGSPSRRAETQADR